MTTTAQVDSIALKRRAEANVGIAAVMVWLFSVFASVPISIRQRDWKLWVWPFMAGFFFFFVAEFEEDKSSAFYYTLLGWGTQGALCGALLAKNKEEAKLLIANETVVNARVVIE